MMSEPINQDGCPVEEIILSLCTIAVGLLSNKTHQTLHFQLQAIKSLKVQSRNLQLSKQEAVVLESCKNKVGL